MQDDDVWAGPPLAAGPFHIREIAYAAGYRQPRHCHRLMGITLVLGGAIREQSGRREEVGEALSVVVKPPGVEHADEVGPRGARTLQIEFDPNRFDTVPEIEAQLRDWRWIHGGAASAAMLALLKVVREGRSATPEAAEDRVLDVIGSLESLPPPSAHPPGWLRRVKQALDEAGIAYPSVRRLARDAGVHEVSLSRAFRRHFGCTIGEYRRRSRLRRAAGSIEAGRAGVSPIAHAAGFSDHAHLCREFRRTTGLTPTEFRSLTRPRCG